MRLFVMFCWIGRMPSTAVVQHYMMNVVLETLRHQDFRVDARHSAVCVIIHWSFWARTLLMHFVIPFHHSHMAALPEKESWCMSRMCFDEELRNGQHTCWGLGALCSIAIYPCWLYSMFWSQYDNFFCFLWNYIVLSSTANYLWKETKAYQYIF